MKLVIIDPAKVTRSVLQNASSIAGLLLTTETMLGRDRDDGDQQQSSGQGQPGGGMPLPSGMGGMPQL